MQVPIMVVGAKESGKTSMIRIYLQKYCHNAISISAAHTQAIFKEFHLQISNLGNLGMD
jgi:molybdopterin-guanine dinucleotide biosynthesis protein